MSGLMDIKITQGEMASLLATLTGFPADRIGGWLVLVRQTCGRQDCVGPGCEGGDLAVLSLANTMDGGLNHGYSLHMMAEAIGAIADSPELLP